MAMAMAMATKDINDARRNYLVNFDTQIVYKIISEDPIGRASGNIPVYKVAYSVLEDKCNERKFVSHEFLSVKKVNYCDSNSILPFSKLYKEIFTRNNALRYHKNLMPVDAHFVDEETEDLCVVMPYAERGSLRSIMADTFPYGFPEVCISVALRSVLKALCFLHNAKILHRDVNAGHVYVNSGPQIMVGFAATVYEHGNFNVECSSHSALPATKISNWGAAPEVYNENQYSEKADIWLVGITALELAYGGIRVPNREALEMLIREIIQTKKLSKKFQLEERKEETKEEKKDKGKKIMEKSDSEERSFSKEFEKMVAECLAWNPGDRPTARTLLKHDFFSKNGLKRSMLKSHFQQVVIKKIDEMSDMKSSPLCVKRRPKSYISIPGHESFDEALNMDLNFTDFDRTFPNVDLSLPSSSYASIDEEPLKWRFKRSKRAKRKLFDQNMGDRDEALWEMKVEGREDSAKAENEGRDERNVEEPELFDENMHGVRDEAFWEIKVEGEEDSSKSGNEGDGSSANNEDEVDDINEIINSSFWPCI